MIINSLRAGISPYNVSPPLGMQLPDSCIPTTKEILNVLHIIVFELSSPTEFLNSDHCMVFFIAFLLFSKPISKSEFY